MVETRDDQLAPGFLLAPPPLGDPNFDRSVVLLAAHEADGSMGFIINRASDMMLHSLLQELEIEVDVPDRRVLVGGPVNGYAGFVLYEHEEDTPLEQGVEITRRISISPSRELLQAAARGDLPGRFELLLGYAGWAPDQLDGELEHGSWLHAPFDAGLLFDVPLERRWEEAYALLGVDPFGFVSVPGGAKA